MNSRKRRSKGHQDSEKASDVILDTYRGLNRKPWPKAPASKGPQEGSNMEFVLLVLALPLVVFALVLTFGPRRSTTAATAPLVPALRTGRVLAWFVAVAFFVAALLLLRANPDFENLVRLIV